MPVFIPLRQVPGYGKKYKWYLKYNEENILQLSLLNLVIVFYFKVNGTNGWVTEGFKLVF